MSTSMGRFLYMVRQGTLKDNVTYRAYDIGGAIKPRHVKEALKALGLEYAGELGVSHFMALYEVTYASDAEVILGGWWLWSQLTKGRHVRVPLRGPGEGSAATTLALDPPSPA